MKSDVDSVLRYLGNAGCVQLITDPGEQRELSAEERELAELQVKVEALAHFLDVPAAAEGTAHAAALERPVLRERVVKLLDDLKGLVEEERELLERRVSLNRTLDDLSAFSDLQVSFGDIDQLSRRVHSVGGGGGDADDRGHLADELHAAVQRGPVVPLVPPVLRVGRHEVLHLSVLPPRHVAGAVQPRRVRRAVVAPVVRHKVRL